MPRYSYSQLVGFARQAGFDAGTAGVMAAIAMAESGGNPQAYNGNTRTGDQSYGLWQINMLGGMGPERRRLFGIGSNNALFDPVQNARAAMAIYRQQGLRAWSVYKSGSYRKYLQGGGGSAAQSTRAVASGGSSWVRPIRSGKQTQAFGRASSGYKSGRHTGLDFGAPAGTPVYAAATGRVVRVANGGAYGRRIEIEHAGKTFTLYAHLSAQTVKPGQQVQAGQLIGRVGNTGNSRGAHLHFEVRKGSNSYGAVVDPTPYLNGRTTPDAYVDMPQDSTTYQAMPLMDMLMGEETRPVNMNIARAAYVYENPVAYMTESESEDPFGASAIETMRPAVGV